MMKIQENEEPARASLLEIESCQMPGTIIMRDVGCLAITLSSKLLFLQDLHMRVFEAQKQHDEEVQDLAKN